MDKNKVKEFKANEKKEAKGGKEKKEAKGAKKNERRMSGSQKPSEGVIPVASTSPKIGGSNPDAENTAFTLRQSQGLNIGEPKNMCCYIVDIKTGVLIIAVITIIIGVGGLINAINTLFWYGDGGPDGGGRGDGLIYGIVSIIILIP